MKTKIKTFFAWFFLIVFGITFLSQLLKFDFTYDPLVDFFTILIYFIVFFICIKYLYTKNKN